MSDKKGYDLKGIFSFLKKKIFKQENNSGSKDIDLDDLLDDLDDLANFEIDPNDLSGSKDIDLDDLANFEIDPNDLIGFDDIDSSNIDASVFNTPPHATLILNYNPFENRFSIDLHRELASKVIIENSIIAPEDIRLQQAIGELEKMINDSRYKEKDYQEFFNVHQHFILTDDHKAAYPHPEMILGTERSRGALIPDFILEPIRDNWVCDILELKTPIPSLYLKNFKGYLSQIYRACEQLRSYGKYFDDNRFRDSFENKYKLKIYKPRLFLIIGRITDINPINAKLIESAIKDVNISTYDDVILRAKNRLSRNKRGI